MGGWLRGGDARPEPDREGKGEKENVQPNQMKRARPPGGGSRRPSVAGYFIIAALVTVYSRSFSSRTASMPSVSGPGTGRFERSTLANRRSITWHRFQRHRVN